MRLSNSKAKTYRRCPKQFYYKYELGLRPKRKSESLTRGDWLHQLLEAHYNPFEGESWREVHKRLTKEFGNMFEEEREELGDLPGETLRIMKSYIRKWKKTDSRLKVVDVELDELLPLPDGDTFNFIIDLIVEDSEGGLWLWDHKTTKNNFMEQDYMLLDAQLARYFWAATVMGYTPLRGVLFNEIRVKAPAVPQLLKAGGLSQRKNIDSDYYTYLSEIERHGLDPADYEDILRILKLKTGTFFRRTMMPKDKALTRRTMKDLLDTSREIKSARQANRFPRTVDKSCTWGCDYKDVCITEYFGGDAKSLMKANFTTKDEMVAKGDS